MILYKTVKNEAIVEQEIKKSKFIAHIKPVSTKDEADEFIAQIRAIHKTATHNVPAIVVGHKMEVQWASDDGEPQGTSGAPIVQMLVNEGVSDVVLVVTRYFGGIKLGTGGLVRAYTSSAKLALEEAAICDVKQMSVLSFDIDYTFLKSIERFCENSEVEILNINYTEKVLIELLTDLENIDNIIKRIETITSGSSRLVDKKEMILKI
ncbi:MAG: YigZ family protein [Eubacteriales bacterium]|nr:YigZ family protein [Eubacteriales bacterium]MDY3332652.1 YigZ family protein [Gallibacter sp.]